MITVLFDIDGTLIRSGGAGMIAIEQAMHELYGVQGRAEVKVHGRTDEGILGDVFQFHGLSYSENREEFSERYWELLPSTMKQSQGALLPGVKVLLKSLAEMDNVELGILTGNARRAAEIKLEHFEIESYFKFGGYGDLHADRNDVAKLAYDEADSFLDHKFDPNKLWVVGDTLADIECARSIGSKVIAVTTGGCDYDTLQKGAPDKVLDDLLVPDLFVETILSI
jgi:phosphoglycolate phosphatase